MCTPPLHLPSLLSMEHHSHSHPVMERLSFSPFGRCGRARVNRPACSMQLGRPGWDLRPGIQPAETLPLTLSLPLLWSRHPAQGLMSSKVLILIAVPGTFWYFHLSNYAVQTLWCGFQPSGLLHMSPHPGERKMAILTRSFLLV